MGTKMQATTNMIISVASLAVASHMVRLWLGTEEDGIRKGNMLTPTVTITMAIPSAELMKAVACIRARLVSAQTMKATIPLRGISQSTGQLRYLSNQAPLTISTVLSMVRLAALVSIPSITRRSEERRVGKECSSRCA